MGMAVFMSWRGWPPWPTSVQCLAAARQPSAHPHHGSVPYYQDAIGKAQHRASPCVQYKWLRRQHFGINPVMGIWSVVDVEHTDY